MSYSRWSNSVWYTYYNVSSGDILDEQRFTVEGDGTFTYKQLKEDIENCLDKCGAIGVEREELKEYMRLFMIDAETGMNK